MLMDSTLLGRKGTRPRHPVSTPFHRQVAELCTPMATEPIRFAAGRRTLDPSQCSESIPLTANQSRLNRRECTESTQENWPLVGRRALSTRVCRERRGASCPRALATIAGTDPGRTVTNTCEPSSSELDVQDRQHNGKCRAVPRVLWYTGAITNHKWLMRRNKSSPALGPTSRQKAKIHTTELLRNAYARARENNNIHTQAVLLAATNGPFY